MRREVFLTCAIAALTTSCAPFTGRSTRGSTDSFEKLERDTGGRLGVYAVDVGSGSAISYRANERFAMCSTFKVLAVAAVLARVDRGEERRDRHVLYTRADLLAYAPITRLHVGEGFMTVSALCEAAIEYSDNTAANLLLKALGGPKSVTEYARSLGDPVTTLNRFEPALNSAIPGDSRDTTTPAAIAADLRRVVLASALSATSSRELTAWLRHCRTGRSLLRAGLPPSWIVGDKTGLGGRTNAAGASDTRNDIAIAWPPHKDPLIIAAYLTGSQLPAAQRDASIASVARIVVEEFKR